MKAIEFEHEATLVTQAIALAQERLDFLTPSGRRLVFILSTFLLCTCANATVGASVNPYQGIVDRNIFGLKPLSPPHETKDSKPPLPKITLTGVTTILGRKLILLTVLVPPKPGEPAKRPQSFILTVGQHESGIEVLEIDMETEGGTVKFDNNGTIQTLSLDKDGPRLTAVAALGAPPRPIGHGAAPITPRQPSLP